MRFTSDKDMDRHIRELVRNGWRWVRGRKHNRLIPPTGGGVVIVATSPSDYRTLLNFLRDVRQISRSRRVP